MTSAISNIDIRKDRMPLHEAAFWMMAFFLGGVFIGSVFAGSTHPFLAATEVAILCAAIFLVFRRREFAALALYIAFGAAYFGWFDARARDVSVPYGEKTAVSGIIRSATRWTDRQELIVELVPPERGRLRIATMSVPERAYGEELRLSGTIRERDGTNGRDIRDRIAGTMAFPGIEVVGAGRGSPFIAFLLRVKSSVEDAFQRFLPPERAAFISGLTIGETAGFSDALREEFRRTGTSHLVALSGYNIAVIAQAIAAVTGFIFARRAAFAAATAGIFVFVLMTGAEASVVRAGIMGFLVLLADQAGRFYSFRNAIAVAAFLMVLANPYMLWFDVGFQLSFVAVAGIVYVKPAFMGAFRVPSTPGFLGWRNNLWTTISAQVAVLPILLLVFGSFSVLSVVVNLLVLLFIPATMALGFLVAGLSFVSSFLALSVAWLTDIFLRYELGVIHFFSQQGGFIEVHGFGVPLVVLYYGALGIFLCFVQQRKPYEAIRA